MEKTYVYKHFNSSGYVGVIDNVVSEFRLAKEINTAGTQIDIEIGASFNDLSPDIETDTLVTEDGDDLITEGFDQIITGAEYVVDGLPSLNDRIEVWQFDSSNLNGLKVFEGLVFKYKASYLSNTTIMTCLSYGIGLDNYLVQILPQSTITSYEFSNYDADLTLYPTFGGTLGVEIGCAQTFQFASTSTLNAIYLYIYNPQGGLQNSINATLSIVEGTPDNPGSVLATVERDIEPNDSPTRTQFLLSTPIEITGTTDYHFTLFNGFFGSDTNILSVSYDSGGGYSSGQLYRFNNSSGYQLPSGDLCFEITTSTGAIGNQFSSHDPSDIVRELIDTYQSLGGRISYTNESITDTNTVVSYTFKFITFLDALKKCVELAPANWYWYIDPSDGTFYFKEKSQSPDHTLVLGKHISDFELSYSLEGVKNKVYFTGGDTGSGENLVTYNSNEASVAQFGSWLHLPSDNRVTNSDTADIMSLSILNQDGRPRFSGSLVVNNTNYDTTTILPGESIVIKNANPLVDSLLLQVMRVKSDPDEATMQLEILPPTVPKRIEDIRRNLKLQQTENNPNDT